MTILLAAGVAMIAGAAGGITALAILAIWATGPTTESETAGERLEHAREVVAEVRRIRRDKGIPDPYERIAYRADQPNRKGAA